MNKRKLYLDTNILLAAADGNIYDQLKDDFSHFDICIAEGSLKELEKLEKQSKGKEKARFRLALQLAQRQHLNIAWQSDSHVDDALVSLAKASSGIIATLDREVQQKARDQGIPVLTLQNGRRLIPAWGGQQL